MFDQTWLDAIPLLREGYHETLLARVEALRTTSIIYPPREQVFRALALTPFDAVRVVLLGQDPYHGPGQAHGLAFSVPEGCKMPPSLRNIFKEITADVYGGDAPSFSTDLTRWAEQGVLLLNATLTVEAGKAGSHQKLGWQALTDQIVETLSRERAGLVFILWGRHAQAKRALIDPARHLILETVHPSPLSAHQGFFGCRHFSQANAYLAARGATPIRW